MNDDASSRADRALQLALLELSPSAADKALGRAALGLPEPRLPMPRLPEPSASPAIGWSALRASGKVGALVCAAMLGVGFGAGYWLGRSERPPAASRSDEPPAVASSPTERDATTNPTDAALPSPSATPSRSPDARVELAAVDAGSDAAPGSPRATPKRPPSVARAARAPAERAPVADARGSHSPPSARGARSGEELALMRRIERSLRNDEPALALTLLAEAESRFPDSALEEERLAASVMAHCSLRDPEHVRRALSFLESRPRSVYRTRVTAACNLSGVPNARNDRAAASDGDARSGDE
ncbi:MAG TPA: hypothetical protein VMG12_15470 [Polyangiaceae bacterium]|nr:hypothetical protein [Polyangiaceae bacterium]